jgi:hypothetical protein
MDHTHKFKLSVLNPGVNRLGELSDPSQNFF